MNTTTIDGIDYTQDANGDWNGSDGSTFTSADFQNYASQAGIGTGYTTGQNEPVMTPGATTSTSSGTDTPPAGATGKDSTGSFWTNALGQIIAPIVVSAATPWLNNLQSGGLLNTATGMLASSGQALGNVRAPDLTQLIPQLRLQVMQGQMTPAQAAAAIQAASNMNSVQTDQGSLQGQRDALAKLANIGSSGGMTEADRAALAATMNQTNANVAQQRAAQLQQLQMQGNAGSGAELAARLSGVQGGANTNAMAGAQIAQAAQQRALQAIQSGLQGNAALNTQQFQQAADKAKSQDLVNQFNAQAQQSTNLANAGYGQQANQSNFNTANTIAGTNTGIQNTQAMMPYEATQKNYENQLGLGKAQTAAQLGAGTALGKMATDQIARSSGAGVGTAAANGTGTTGTGTTAGTGNTSSGNSIGNAVVNGVINNAGDLWSGAKDLVSSAGDAISNGASSVSDWLSGLKDGGYVEPHNGEMSDEDVDHLMAKLTEYKYRRK